MRYYDSFHGNLSGRQESAIARKKLEAIQSKDVRGLKYFDRLAPLLQRLHDDGCARYKAANRLLFYDQYSMLILLYFFNPTVTSLRAIQQASELQKVQKKLGCRHLLSHSDNGIEIQTYCAIIACMLMDANQPNGPSR